MFSGLINLFNWNWNHKPLSGSFLPSSSFLLSLPLYLYYLLLITLIWCTHVIKFQIVCGMRPRPVNLEMVMKNLNNFKWISGYLNRILGRGLCGVVATNPTPPPLWSHWKQLQSHWKQLWWTHWKHTITLKITLITQKDRDHTENTKPDWEHIWSQ